MAQEEIGNMYRGANITEYFWGRTLNEGLLEWK